MSSIETRGSWHQSLATTLETAIRNFSRENVSRYRVIVAIQITMAKKPAGLIYGVDDKPPLITTVLLGIQHVFVMTAGWIIVVVIVTTIGGTQEEVANVLRMSMIASGIATILQSLPNGP